MYAPVLELASFDSLSLDQRLWCLGYMLEMLAQIDRQYLLANPRTPPLYAFKPRYAIKERPWVVYTPVPGMGTTFKIDRWQDIPRTMQLGFGDCKDFAAWRVAELRNMGVPDVGFHIRPTRVSNLDIYHVLVRNGIALEDPSANLGMPPPGSVPLSMLQQ